MLGRPLSQFARLFRLGCVLGFVCLGAREAQAQEIRLKLDRSVYLQKAEEEPFYLMRVDFPNINRIPFYENRALRKRIAQLENPRSGEIDYAGLHDALMQYVTNFGIENFSRDRDLDMLWKLGQIKEVLQDTVGALFFYSIALKNNSRHFSQIRIQFDTLQALKRVEFVDLDYYYRIVAARLKIDTLAPPQSVLLQLGEDVNSPYPDYAPYMHPSGSVLLFTSRRTDLPPITPTDYGQVEDLYYTERDYVDSAWMAARRFPNTINSPFNEGSACLNVEGDVIYFTRCNSPEGMGSCDIYMAEYTGGSWSNVHNLGAKVNSPFWDSQPNLTSDGQALFFCSNRPGGFGRTDLYVCHRQPDSSWGPANNLGPVVNTIEEEITPFFHPINNTLYFSSTGHLQNHGGFDIFKSRIREGHWEEPHNLGPLVNSVGDESYFSIDGKGENLYYAMGRPNDPRNTDLFSFPMPMAARPDAVFRLNGYMIDTASGHPLTGIVVAIDLDEGVEIEPIYINRSGFFEFRMINNRHYQLLVIGENNVRVDAREAANQDSVFRRIATSIESQKALVFDALEFGQNSTEVNDILAPQLDVLAEFLRLHPYCRLIVRGHTDSDGEADYNLRLSQQRAEAIRGYLLASANIDSSMVMAEGYGETRPVYPNDSRAHKALNRRVEFELIVPPQYREEYFASLEQIFRQVMAESPALITDAADVETFDDDEALLDHSLEADGMDGMEDLQASIDIAGIEGTTADRDAFLAAFSDEFGAGNLEEARQANARLEFLMGEAEDDQEIIVTADYNQVFEAGIVPQIVDGNPADNAAAATPQPEALPEPGPDILAENPLPEPEPTPEPVPPVAETAQPEPQHQDSDDFEVGFEDFAEEFAIAEDEISATDLLEFEYSVNADINQSIANPELGAMDDSEDVLEASMPGATSFDVNYDDQGAFDEFRNPAAEPTED